MKISHFTALASVFLVVGACNGMSSVGGDEGDTGDDEAGGGTAGSMGGSGATAGTGMRGGSGGTGATGATAGTGGSVPSPCAGKPCGAECSFCTGAGEMDPQTGMGIPCDAAVRYCDASGACGTAFPVCETECNTPMDCAVPDIPCQTCADGSVQCPTADCQMGRCAWTYPSCGAECTADSECLILPAPCQMCPDGTTSCPKPACLMGRCTASWPGCGGGNPCEGLECGEPCNPTCTEMGCGMAGAVAFSCNFEGKCVAEPPRCGAECGPTNGCLAPAVCQMCPGGTCGTVDCVNGRCEIVCPPVDPPEPECTTAMDCVADTVCRPCPDMSCAQVACLDGECKSVCPL